MKKKTQTAMVEVISCELQFVLRDDINASENIKNKIKSTEK